MIDKLIDVIIAANTREEMTTACRALDRVIRAGRYWIPHWYKASHWIAYWDVFSRPAAQPRYFRGIPDTWWYDRRRLPNWNEKVRVPSSAGSAEPSLEVRPAAIRGAPAHLG